MNVCQRHRANQRRSASIFQERTFVTADQEILKYIIHATEVSGNKEDMVTSLIEFM